MNVSVITMAPGRDGPEAHVHADEDDIFYVLDGELTFDVGHGRGLLRQPGTSCWCRRASSHTFANRTAEPVRVLNIHAPAGFDRRLMGD